MHKKYQSFLILSFFILLFQSVIARTLEFSLQGDGDVVNQTGANLDENSIHCQNLKPESWIGSEGGSQGVPSYLALRFYRNQTLPSNIKVISAKLRLTNNRGKEQKVLTAFELRAETSQNPTPFLCTQLASQPLPANNLPSQRTVTQAVSNYASDAVWAKDSVWEIDATAPLQELSQNGKLSDHIALIIKGTGDRLGKRYFFNHRQSNAALNSLPKLVIEYLTPLYLPPAMAQSIELSFNNQDIATINGEAGSVTANLQVTITNLRTNETLTTTANATGSFSATIPAQAKDILRLIVSNPAIFQQSKPTNLVVPLPALPASPNVNLIKATLNQSSVQIMGETNSVSANSQVVVFNTLNNKEVKTTANADGSFNATLSANGGESLLIYIVDRYNQQSIKINIQTPLPDQPPIPNASLIHLTVNQGIAQVVGFINSVTANLPVTVLIPSTDQKVTATAAANGSFNVSLPVNGGEKLLLYVTNHFTQKDSESITLNVPTLPTPIHLTITHPPMDATVNNRLIKIEGTHDGLANTGILINGETIWVRNGQLADGNKATRDGLVNTGILLGGKVALVSNGRFAIDNVFLKAGVNTITVTAFSLQGKAGEVVVNVSALDSLPLLTLSSNSKSGLAPFEATFKYHIGGTLPFTNLTLDFEGDGIVDFNTADNAATLPSHIYSNAGWYSPTITLTDAQGTTHTAQTTLLVQDPNQIDAMFLEMWQGMNNALIAKDKTTALQFLNPRAKRKYRPIFDVLMPHMPEIVASYSPLARSEVSDSIGEYTLVRSYQGKKVIRFIHFLKDKDGVWRIDEM